MNEQLEPKLAAPGAGLPLPELLIARMLFRLQRLRGNRETFKAKFNEERAKIRRLIDDLEPNLARQRVLIKRPRGLEDSSRYWSVWMTLEHLRIVHESITRVVDALANGVMPAGKASTAAVKPSAAVGAEIVDEYERSCDQLTVRLAAIPDCKTKLRYAHPWFGPLDVAGWHALAGRHLSIHRVQIERIVTGCSAQRKSRERLGTVAAAKLFIPV